MMPLDEPAVFRNGSWIPQSQAGIALNDLGFVQGVTVTDLVRTIGGKPYLSREHASRFCETLDQLGIPRHTQASVETLTKWIEEIVAKNLPLYPAGTELAVVLLGTPGPLDHYLPSGSASGPTLILHTFPISRPRYAGWFEKGAALRLARTVQVPPECFSPNLKVRSRLHWWLAEKEVRNQDPGALALLCNQKGEILETALAHVVAVIQGELVAPPAEAVLTGVSLQALAKIAAAEGLAFQRRSLFSRDLRQASEILLTGTMFCLAGVSHFEGETVPWPGPILERLQKRWWREIGQNLSSWFLSSP